LFTSGRKSDILHEVGKFFAAFFYDFSPAARRAVAPARVNGDWLCQWEMVIFDNRIDTPDPQPIIKKIGRLRWQPIHLYQIWCKSVHGELVGKWIRNVAMVTN